MDAGTNLTPSNTMDNSIGQVVPFNDPYQEPTDLITAQAGGGQEGQKTPNYPLFEGDSFGAECVACDKTYWCDNCAINDEETPICDECMYQTPNMFLCQSCSVPVKRVPIGHRRMTYPLMYDPAYDPNKMPGFSAWSKEFAESLKAESFSAEETEGARCMRRLDEMIDSMQESADGYLTRHPVDGYSTQYPDMKVVLPSDEHEDYTEVADGMVESTDAQQLAADMVLRAMEMRDMSDDLGSNLEYGAESFSEAGLELRTAGRCGCEQDDLWEVVNVESPVFLCSTCGYAGNKKEDGHFMHMKNIWNAESFAVEWDEDGYAEKQARYLHTLVEDAMRNGCWTKQESMEIMDEASDLGMTIREAETFESESLVEEPDWIPAGDGRALGQQNLDINLSPLHAEYGVVLDRDVSQEADIPDPIEGDDKEDVREKVKDMMEEEKWGYDEQDLDWEDGLVHDGSVIGSIFPMAENYDAEGNLKDYNPITMVVLGIIGGIGVALGAQSLVK